MVRNTVNDECRACSADKADEDLLNEISAASLARLYACHLIKPATILKVLNRYVNQPLKAESQVRAGHPIRLAIEVSIAQSARRRETRYEQDLASHVLIHFYCSAMSPLRQSSP